MAEHEYIIRLKGILDSSTMKVIQRVNEQMKGFTRTQEQMNQNSRAGGLTEQLQQMNGITGQINRYQATMYDIGGIQRQIKANRDGIREMEINREESIRRVQEINQRLESSRSRATENVQAYNQGKERLSTLRAELTLLKERKQAIKAGGGSTAEIDSEIRAQKAKINELRSSLSEMRKIKVVDNAAIRTQMQEYKTALQELGNISQQIGRRELTDNNLTAQYRAQSEAIRRMRQELTEAGVNVRNLANEEARLRNELDRTTQALNEQQIRENRRIQARENVNEASSRLDNAMNNFSGVTSTIQGAISPVMSALDTAVDFEASVSKVKAIMGAGTDINIDEVVTLAKELGATTKFKASEAMDAAYYGALAGWNKEQIVAAMPTALNVAQANDVGIDESMDMITDMMTAAGLDTTDSAAVKRFGDQISYLTTNSNTDFRQLREALSYSMAAGHQAGMSVEQILAITGAEANAGIKSSMAGTALRKWALNTMDVGQVDEKTLKALDLGNKSDFTKMQAEMQQAMASRFTPEQIESFKNPVDGMINMLEAFADLGQNLSDSERANVIKQFTGLTAFSGIAPVIEAAIKGVNEDGEQVNISALRELFNGVSNSEGTAEKIAKIMSDNTKGSEQIFESVMEALQLELGGMLLPYMRATYDMAAEMLAEFTLWISNNHELVMTIMQVSAGIAGLITAGAGLNVAFQGLNFAKAGFEMLSAEVRMLPTALTAVRSAFLGINAGMLPMLAIGALIAGLAYLIYDNWGQIGPILEEAWFRISIAAQSALIPIKSAIDLLMLAWARLNIATSEMDLSWLETLSTYLLAGFSGLVTFISGLVITIINIFSDLATMVVNIITGMVNMVSALINGDFVGAFSSAIDVIGSLFSGLVNAIVSLIGGLINSVSSALSSISTVGSMIGGSATVAHNAEGGIYRRGAFLTTFAEKSAEAAIPLDGSQRAINLWYRAGQMLGLVGGSSGYDNSSEAEVMSMIGMQGEIENQNNIGLQSETKPIYDEEGNITNIDVPEYNRINTDDSITVRKAKEEAQKRQYAEENEENEISNADNRTESSNFSVVINISGNADNGVVDQIRETFAEQYARYMHERSRVAFA